MPDTAIFPRAAVAAPHALAAETGQAVLEAGGNAIEAMIAMAATIAVVYPHMNGMGGDGFWLIRTPDGRLHGIDACGPAGSLATIGRYRAAGHDTIPARGPEAALTVAGAVGGWAMAEELSRSLGGRLPRDLLLGDALRHAREGYAISPSEARYRLKPDDALLSAPGFATTFRASEKPFEPGARRSLPRLADTLEQLAKAGFEDFYRGDIGRETAADLARIGAPITRADLEACRATPVTPLSVALNGCTTCNLPPPTQGLAALVILGLFERLGVTRCDSFEHIHGLVEASKLALDLRDRVVTDPARLRADPAAHLAPAALEQLAQRIDRRRAACWPLATDGGDTVWMGAIDASGLAVSYIQSIYWEYGSGCVLAATGIHWQNRGISFSLDPAARNPLAPGAKPFHTLNPALAVFDDGRVAAYGAMGGDGQPQFQAQVLSRYRFGRSVADAVDAPRFLFGRSWGNPSTTLKIENRFDLTVVARLAAAGHELEEWGVPYDDQFGHAGLIVRHPRGEIHASHDPRSDGGALGL